MLGMQQDFCSIPDKGFSAITRIRNAGAIQEYTIYFSV